MIEKIYIDKLPYESLYLVGELLFNEYPSTLVYSDENRTPYIVEWFDVNNDVDRFFIYQTNLLYLHQYINGKITHHQLIKNSNNIFIFFDNQIEYPRNIYQLNTENIDDIMIGIIQRYLPSHESIFNEADSKDILKIKTFFEL